MLADDNETTPLLIRDCNQSVISSQEGDDTFERRAELRQQHSHNTFASSYRRPSFVAPGGRGLILSSSPVPESALRDDEAFECVLDEQELLKRNKIDLHFAAARRGSVTAETLAEVEETWEEAVKERRIGTSWKYELAVIARYSVHIFFDELLIVGAVGSNFPYQSTIERV